MPRSMSSVVAQALRPPWYAHYYYYYYYRVLLLLLILLSLSLILNTIITIITIIITALRPPGASSGAATSQPRATTAEALRTSVRRSSCCSRAAAAPAFAAGRGTSRSSTSPRSIQSCSCPQRRRQALKARTWRLAKSLARAVRQGEHVMGSRPRGAIIHSNIHT